MWFLWPLLHPANVLFTTNEGSNQLCAFTGEITLTPNSVSQPSGFLSNGKDSQIKSSVLCMPVTERHAEGVRRPVEKQTHGKTELFIQLYTLFGGGMSFLIEKAFAVCHDGLLILNSALEKLGVRASVVADNNVSLAQRMETPVILHQCFIRVVVMPTIFDAQVTNKLVPAELSHLSVQTGVNQKYMPQFIYFFCTFLL